MSLAAALNLSQRCDLKLLELDRFANLFFFQLTLELKSSCKFFSTFIFGSLNGRFQRKVRVRMRSSLQAFQDYKSTLDHVSIQNISGSGAPHRSWARFESEIFLVSYSYNRQQRGKPEHVEYDSKRGSRSKEPRNSLNWCQVESDNSMIATMKFA